MGVGRGQLVRLAAAKGVSSSALRWVPFFLFVLEDAFSTTTTTLTLIIGLADLVGLGTLLIAGQMDRGKERTYVVGALILVSAAGVVALGGSVVSFAVAFVMLVAGNSLVTVAGHTWLSLRVPFERLGRAIGTFETAWAFALLVGAPIAALSIELFGWRGPFVLVALAGAGMAIAVAQLPDDRPASADGDAEGAGDDGAAPEPAGRLSRRAWTLVASSAMIQLAGLSTIVIAGTWLEDSFGVSTGEVGLAAMAFGLAELVASTASARFSDGFGLARTTAIALTGVMAGLAIMAGSGSLAVAIVGLGVFFVGFEYAVVTSFSIVGSAAPEARGRALATNNAVGTLVRGGGTVASGYLFETYGIGGPVTFSLIATVLALLLLGEGHRRR